LSLLYSDNINIGSGFGSKNAVRVIGPGSVWTNSGSFGVGGDGVCSVMVLGKWC